MVAFFTQGVALGYYVLPLQGKDYSPSLFNYLAKILIVDSAYSL